MFSVNKFVRLLLVFYITRRFVDHSTHTLYNTLKVCYDMKQKSDVVFKFILAGR